MLCARDTRIFNSNKKDFLVLPQVGKADDDISISSTIMSLRDPLSGARVSSPARFKGTSGLVAFDLDTFLGMAKRTRKWQCPHSMRHTRVQELQLDSYVAQIIKSLEARRFIRCSYSKS